MKLAHIKEAFKTLLYSWSSDAPPEATWAANEFMEAILFPETIVELKEDSSNVNEFLNQLGE